MVSSILFAMIVSFAHNDLIKVYHAL